jgi:hypothetical protein
MCEMDFTDMYWQLKFNASKPRSNKKIAYLCIKTLFGTMAYTRAPMGLLGMDVFQDQLTDKLFVTSSSKGSYAKSQTISTLGANP